MRIFMAALSALACVSFSSAYLLSQQQFTNAVTSAGYPAPAGDIYAPFAAATKDFSQAELAMFMAQVIHESGGFRYREEIACSGPNGCPGQYVDHVGLPGKSYHGRGFIQLTWGANYKAASEGLGLGDKLLQHPELVSQQLDLSIAVSVWYWTARVRPQLVGHENQFGATTKAINGALECSGGFNQRAANRYKIYLKVADALGVQNKAVENGCYN